MNIDERIETLARNVESFYLQSQRRRIEGGLGNEDRVTIDDRLEALTQSVELLYLSSKNSDTRMDQLRQSVAELVANSDRLWMLHTSQDRNLSLHERRLDQHDTRLHNLDGGLSPNG